MPYPVAAVRGKGFGNPQYSDLVLSLSPLAYWPLLSNALDISGNGYHGAATAVTFDGLKATLDGTTSFINVYSAGLAGTFNGAELSLMAWFVPDSWTDGVARRIVGFRVDANNYIELRKDTANNTYTATYKAGGTDKPATVGSMTFTSLTHIAITVSKSNDRVRFYRGGTQHYALTSLGTWTGSLASTTTVLGALNTTPSQVFDGNLAHVALFDRELTDWEVAVGANPFGLDTLSPSSWVDWYPGTQRIVWISDVHRSNIYTGDSWSNIIRLINTIRPEFTIDTGDMTVAGTVNEFLDYNAEAGDLIDPLYTTPGNHDGSPGNLANYDAAGLMRHFAADVGNFRVIGFTSYQEEEGIATYSLISADEKAWVLNELQNLDGKTPILATHYSLNFLIDGESWATLADDLATYGVKAFLSGHNHLNCPTETTGNCVNILGASIYGEIVGQTPGLMVWYVFDDRLELQFVHARHPFEIFNETTTPAYTKVVITR